MKALKKHKFILPVDLAKEEIPKPFLVSESAAGTPAKPAATASAETKTAAGAGSNMNRDKFYDQIAFYSKKNELELGKSKNKAGVFNLYDAVFREADWKTYYDLSNIKPKWGKTDDARKTYFAKKWRTWQMSDHLPLWTELNIDFTDKYLIKLSGGDKK